MQKVIHAEIWVIFLAAVLVYLGWKRLMSGWEKAREAWRFKRTAIKTVGRIIQLRKGECTVGFKLQTGELCIIEEPEYQLYEDHLDTEIDVWYDPQNPQKADVGRRDSSDRLWDGATEMFIGLVFLAFVAFVGWLLYLKSSLDKF